METAIQTVQFDPVRSTDEMATREWAAALVLRGKGLDIGALHRPLRIPPEATVRYVDRFPKAKLLEHYPELSQFPIIDPDVIDDGERLVTIGDQSQDFVIASHFLEHTQDPVGCIKTFCRVVRPGGILFLVLPEREAFFDKDRPLTSVAHLIQDHEMSPSYTRRSHYLEYAEFVDRKTDPEVFEHAWKLMEREYSIHFHVWSGETFLEHMSVLKLRYGLPVDLMMAVRGRGELIAIYQRTR